MNILIVDDSATTRSMLKRTLRMADLPLDELYDVANGQEALDAMARLSVDLVLADLHMPVMGGAEMIRRMRADASRKPIPVVIISADPNSARGEELQELGALAFIRKPFTAEQIREVITRVTAAVAAARAA
jgi:two-component system chemotaxis response regulator CheY